MSIWFRRRQQAPEQRASQFAPTAPYPVAYGSFASVDVSTMEASLQSIAVHAAVDLIASLGSELPVDIFRGKGRDREALPMPSYLEDPAGDGNGLADWSYQVLESWLLRGNLYGDILEKAARGGYPTQVNLFHPDDVHGWLDPDGYVHWSACGQDVPTDRMFHRRVNPVPGRVKGLSPIAAHAVQVELNLTVNQFGLQWFRDGAHPGGILSNSEEDMSDPVKAKTAKERFMAALRGTREPVVLGKGWKFDKVQIAPNESQFLETHGYSAAECARIFGPGIPEVLGYETGKSTLTYANLVDRDLQLLKYATNRWFRRLERLYTSMLPRPQYARIDRAALLETATLERYRAHALALKNRWRTVNEVRDDEDEPPVAWGDEPNPPTGGGDDDGEAPRKDGT